MPVPPLGALSPSNMPRLPRLPTSDTSAADRDAFFSAVAGPTPNSAVLVPGRVYTTAYPTGKPSILWASFCHKEAIAQPW